MRELKHQLSESIVKKVPQKRRTLCISNVAWISRNIELTPLEREEVVALLKELRRKWI